MRRGMAWVAVAIGMALWPGTAGAAQYTIDKDHTTVGFKIRHLFSQVTGSFDEYEGTFVYTSGQPETWVVNATIQAASINTRVAMRDNHLRSKDFFHAEQYPTITFRSTHVADTTSSGAKVHGLLTIHGVEKPVVLDLEIHGEGKDPWGNVRSGFTARTRINRKDFGLTWNEKLETGQLLVGEEVDIILEVEGIAQG